MSWPRRCVAWQWPPSLRRRKLRATRRRRRKHDERKPRQQRRPPLQLLIDRRAAAWPSQQQHQQQSVRLTAPPSELRARCACVRALNHYWQAWFCTIFSSNYAHCPHTMSVYLSGVCSPVSPPVRLYVPAWAHSSKPAAAGLLLWARPAGDNDQLLHGTQQRGVRWANAGATLSAYVGSWTQTCYTNFMLGLGLEVLIS